VGFFSIGLILLSLILPWEEYTNYYGVTNGQTFNVLNHPNDLASYIIFFTFTGLLSCFMRSNLLLISGIFIFIVLWVPFDRGRFLLDNHDFYPGTVLVNIGMIFLFLNQFLPDYKISKYVELAKRFILRKH
jgi:hypothetical protein